MGSEHLIPADARDPYEVHEWRNAAAVLSASKPVEWEDILDVLRTFRL